MFKGGFIGSMQPQDVLESGVNTVSLGKLLPSVYHWREKWNWRGWDLAAIGEESDSMWRGQGWQKHKHSDQGRERPACVQGHVQC